MRQKVVPRANREAIAGFIRPPLQLGLVKPGTDFRHEVLGLLRLDSKGHSHRESRLSFWRLQTSGRQLFAKNEARSLKLVACSERPLFAFLRARRN